MLTELRITNFALIDHLQLEFSPGFQVLTGETGAGKSLLVDALVLLLGGRASGEHLRTGADEATLEAVFSLPKCGTIRDRLRAWGLQSGDDDQELLIRRVLSRSGRSRMFVNGSLVPLHQMQELGEHLVDVHGQHEQQSLLSARVQLDLVDAFGGLLELRDRYATHFQDWLHLLSEKDTLMCQTQERQEREEFLRFQLEELSKARLKVGEEEELLQEHRRLKNSSALLELSNEVYTLLLNDDQSILSQLNLIKKNLDDLLEIDASTKVWGALAEGALAPLQELALAARSYRESFDHEPHALESIDERLATIQRLKKKYRESEEGLISKQGNLQAELEQLTNLEARLDELEQALTSKNRQAQGLAKELSVSRSQVAQKLEKRIATELASLKMKGTKFRIQISKSSGTEELGPTGLDQVEFGFCANPGEAVQPLNRVVSGGELSRLMLAIKTVLANVDRVPVLIFDEVDTGIGGHVAAVMGQRLRTLGQLHQVFGITHLPQIASQANAHFKVEKQVVNHRTVTTVISLKPKEREEEIARMLGGTKVTQTVRKAAAEMLKTAPL